MPTPGECSGGAGALTERLEDVLAVLERHARAVVLDDQQRAARLGTDADPDLRTGGRVPDRVREQVLDDALDLRAVRLDRGRFEVQLDRVVGRQVGFAHDAPHELVEVGGAKVRLEDPARDPVQVQQVGDDAVELARVHRDARSEVVRLVRPEIGLALERDGEPEDRGEGRPQVVRDRLQERRLELVDRAELGGLLALGLERAFELGRAVLLGEVDPHALPELRLALLVADQHRLVVDPYDAAVLRDHPVLDVVGAVRLLGEHRRLEDPFAIVGVHQLGPQRRVGGQLVRGVADEGLHLRAEVRARVVGPVRVDVGHDRRLLDERPVAFLGLLEPFERGRAVDRLVHHALPVQRSAFLVADQHGLVVDPHDPTVLGEHPVVGAVRRARGDDGLVRGPHRRHVVGVQAIDPPGGLGQPLLDRVAQDAFDAGADVQERTGPLDPRVRVFEVHHAGEVVEQRPEAFELVLGLVARRQTARLGARHRGGIVVRWRDDLSAILAEDGLRSPGARAPGSRRRTPPCAGPRRTPTRRPARRRSWRARSAAAGRP